MTWGNGGRQRSGVAWFLVVVAVAAAIVLLLLFVPEWLVDFRGLGNGLSLADRVKAVTEERRSILALLAAVGAAVTIYYTHLRHELDRDSNRTDRYTKAVEQLAHSSLHVQLGGIYALERIALDSVRDRGVISEVLSAFVREQSRAEPVPDRESASINAPSTVVRATCSVLARRPRDKTYLPAQLTGANLARISVIKGNLDRASLNGATLTGAVLTETTLAGADLSGADLSYANLRAANLSGAKLIDANLRGASLDGANFSSADVSGADVRDTLLAPADGRRALGVLRAETSHLPGNWYCRMLE
jgi:hypothetical protein